MSEDYKADAVGYKHPPGRISSPGTNRGTRAGDPRERAISGRSCRNSAKWSPCAMASGRSKMFSKQRALIKSLVAAAIDGNQRAAASLLAICVRMLADAADDEAIDSVEDRGVEAFSKRTKRAAAAGAKS